MRPISPAILLALLAVACAACATSPAEQEAARRAWAARDAERERECQRALGWWKAGACVFGGGGGGSM